MVRRQSRKWPGFWLVGVALAAGGSLAAQPQTVVDASVGDKLAALEAGQSALLEEVKDLVTSVAELRSLLRAPTGSGPPRAAHLPDAPVPLTWAHLKGSAQAGVVLIEDSDFQCPYCAAFFRSTLPLVEARYLASDRIRLAFWNLPLVDLHPRALRAAEAAECAAGQGRFWEMHDLLFSDPVRLDDASLVERARALGLDLATFSTCLHDDATSREVQQQASAAARVLVAAGTPTFLVGTVQPGGAVKVVERLDGAKDFRAFQDAIDPLLNTPAQNWRS